MTLPACPRWFDDLPPADAIGYVADAWIRDDGSLLVECAFPKPRIDFQAGGPTEAVATLPTFDDVGDEFPPPAGATATVRVETPPNVRLTPEAKEQLRDELENRDIPVRDMRRRRR